MSGLIYDVSPDVTRRTLPSRNGHHENVEPDSVSALKSNPSAIRRIGADTSSTWQARTRRPRRIWRCRSARSPNDLERLCRSFRPKLITTLLVEESPPHGGTFFYKQDSRPSKKEG